MDGKIETALREWLRAIMPLITESLAEKFTTETLTEMSKDEGIQGPIFINLKEYGAPITAINFYFILVEETMLMATTADIEGAPENNKPELKFSHFFTFDEFHTAIMEKDCLNEIIDTLIEAV